jgi:hypothetical protein
MTHLVNENSTQAIRTRAQSRSEQENASARRLRETRNRCRGTIGDPHDRDRGIELGVEPRGSGDVGGGRLAGERRGERRRGRRAFDGDARRRERRAGENEYERE